MYNTCMNNGKLSKTDIENNFVQILDKYPKSIEKTISICFDLVLECFIVMYGENLNIENTLIPSDYKLYQSYPNPFNPVTNLVFDTAKSGIISFTIFNINGQIIDKIKPKFYNPGQYKTKWEARDIPTGIYLVKMQTQSSAYLQKVMYLK